MSEYTCVSADGHIAEPPDLWANFPRGMEDVAPKFLRTEKGDGWVLGPGAQWEAPMQPRRQSDGGPIYFDTLPRGAYDPAARLKDMELDGVDADVLFPGVARYLDRGANEKSRLAIAQIYNEWLADFCKFEPSRLFGVGIVPAIDDNDGQNAVLALRHAYSLGLRLVMPNKARDGGGLPLHHPAGEKFWTAAEELGVPVVLHAYSNPYLPRTKGFENISGTMEAVRCLSFGGAAESLAQLIWGGVFKRHPRLHVSFVESGAGWIAYALERQDQVFEAHKHMTASDITERPSETFRRQCSATFGEERSGVLVRDILGVENLMWASDYPHNDSPWPESQRQIAWLMEGVPAEDKRKLTCENALRLFKLAAN